MSSRFWVGGGSSANWNATGNTNWGTASNTQDNASVPGSTDDVYFDGVGVGASNSTCSASITVRSLNFTGYTNTFTHSSSVIISIGDGTAGAGNVALKLVTGMTYTKSGLTSSQFYFISTSTTQQTIATGGKTMGTFLFNGVAGSWIHTSALTISGGIFIANGTWDTGGYQID